MKSSLLLFWILFTLMYQFVEGQNKCGTDVIHKQRLQKDSSYRSFFNSLNNSLKNNFNSVLRQDSNLINFPDTIPVVVHVVHDGAPVGSQTNPSDQKIIDLIDFTNQVFEGKYPLNSTAGDIGIRFVLAQRDEQCNPTNGIDRIDGNLLPNYIKYGISGVGQGVTLNDLFNFIKWDPNRYYNIWIVLSIENGAIAGVASYPINNKTDGTVIINSVVGQSTVLAHELGHAFFLFHTFEGSNGSVCPANNDCSLDGDRVCDTDPVTIASETLDSLNPCTNTPYTISTAKNIMGYGIQEIFTYGQKMRMQAAAALPLRDTLRKSLARYKPDEFLACDFTLRLNGELKNNDVYLNWKYGSSLPKNKIWIQRSYDGFHFNNLNYVQPVNNLEEYNFHDPDIAQQNNYYRLMQTQDNGVVRYSNILTIKNPLINSNSFIVLGNPVRNNQIELEFGNFDQPLNFYSSSSSYNAEIFLIDISGKILLHSFASISSYERYRIKLSYIPSGIFFIKLLVNNHVYIKKVVRY